MTSDTCPKCNSPLEEGNIGAAQYLIWGKKLKWYSHAFSGERIAFKPFRTVYVKAQRCPHCRIILFEY